MPPMVPPAPPRLSTTTGWPSRSPTCAATGRAKMSFDPPGGNGTIQFRACAGQSAARSGPATPAASRPPSALRRETFIGSPCPLSDSRRQTRAHSEKVKPRHLILRSIAQRCVSKDGQPALPSPTTARGLPRAIETRPAAAPRGEVILSKRELAPVPGSACRRRLGRFRALPQNGTHDGAGDAQPGKGNGDVAEDRAQQGAEHALLDRQHGLGVAAAARQVRRQPVAPGLVEGESVDRGAAAIADRVAGDRKSTRLNSTHTLISSPVFSLKKK